MIRSTVFRTKRGQSMRLPKAVVFPARVREVEIFKAGSSLVICPVGKHWEYWFKYGPRLSGDFNTGTEPPVERREPF